MDNLEQDAIRQVLAGDADRYPILMDRHLPAVLQMTFRVTGSMEDAEEAAQEAFLRAYNKLPTFREHAAFGTWVYRIAMNCALNLIDRRQRNPAWDAVSLDGTPQTEDLLVSEEPTPEAVLLRAEAVLGRDRLLGCLTPMERSAFVLRHLEEQPVVAIAAALGVTATRLARRFFAPRPSCDGSSLARILPEGGGTGGVVCGHGYAGLPVAHRHLRERGAGGTGERGAGGGDS